MPDLRKIINWTAMDCLPLVFFVSCARQFGRRSRQEIKSNARSRC